MNIRDDALELLFSQSPFIYLYCFLNDGKAASRAQRTKDDDSHDR